MRESGGGSRAPLLWTRRRGRPARAEVARPSVWARRSGPRRGTAPHPRGGLLVAALPRRRQNYELPDYVTAWGARSACGQATGSRLPCSMHRMGVPVATPLSQAARLQPASTPPGRPRGPSCGRQLGGPQFAATLRARSSPQRLEPPYRASCPRLRRCQLDLTVS
jgi:hypothetical protein